MSPKAPAKIEMSATLKDQGFSNPAAGHVEEVRHRAVEDAVDHVADRPADEEPADR
jgi:hypothetical protein